MFVTKCELLSNAAASNKSQKYLLIRIALVEMTPETGPYDHLDRAVRWQPGGRWAEHG